MSRKQCLPSLMRTGSPWPPDMVNTAHSGDHTGDGALCLLPASRRERPDASAHPPGPLLLRKPPGSGAAPAAKLECSESLTPTRNLVSSLSPKVTEDNQITYE